MILDPRLKQLILGFYSAGLGPSLRFSFTLSFEPHHGCKLRQSKAAARHYGGVHPATCFSRVLRRLRLSHLTCSNCTRGCFSIYVLPSAAALASSGVLRFPSSPPAGAASAPFFCTLQPPDRFSHVSFNSPSPRARSPVQGTAIPCACPFQTKTSSRMPQPLRLL
jgi:hypothetical protein